MLASVLLLMIGPMIDAPAVYYVVWSLNLIVSTANRMLKIREKQRRDSEDDFTKN